MSVELTIPQAGESITEVQIAEWRRAEGDVVARDEIVAEIETDKASMELPAPVGGRLARVLKKAGETASVGEVIAVIDESEAAAPTRAPSAASPSAAKAPAEQAPEQRRAERHGERVMPAARRKLAEHGLEPDDVAASGPGGRLLKEDVQRHVRSGAPVRTERGASASGRGGDSEFEAQSSETRDQSSETRDQSSETRDQSSETRVQSSETSDQSSETRDQSSETRVQSSETKAQSSELKAQRPELVDGYREEEVVPMTMIRRRIAQRLVDAQQTAALLTTFNEIDMSAVIALRKEFQERYQEQHQVKLGFMSFFVKAAIDALKLVPQINAEVRGTDIVYRNYYDIGVAVGGGKGLVVPVLRSAERMSFAEIEKAIGDFGRRAKENKLTVEELQGGTFTISNGGVYGSLLSTPIINPPQSGILGLHAIQDRPVARDGQVVIAPMMYVALTYDHRIVDGREAVTFLRRVKDCVEQPARMLIEV